MISIGELSVVIILLLLLILLLDLGVISEIRTIEKKAIQVEGFFEKDRAEDSYVKAGAGSPARYR